MGEIIIFRKNEKDEYFRKSTEFAAADVVLRDDSKLSGSVERLSATILKGVQDQLFSLARQKHIESVSKQMTIELSAEYKKEFIAQYIKDMKKADKAKSPERLLEDAERTYEMKKMAIDRLAEKEAWKTTIAAEIKDDELFFKFDTQSILEYARVNGGRKDRLYEDVKRIQQRFNNWTEKKFDNGKIVDKEVAGVLFPYSECTKGTNSTIQIKLSKELLHCVLFLNKNFLKYHHESYIKVGGSPNAARLFELLVDSTCGNISVSSRALTFDYLQKRFSTSYKNFFHFLNRLMTPSLQKINSELGTDITWVADKKKGRSTESIKFVISDYDRKVLQGIRDENIDEAVLCSFEFYLTLVSLGGQKAQGGLRVIYEKIRGQVNDGTFSYFGKTRDEMVEEHFKNMEDAEELEILVSGDEVLQRKYAYDHNYLNVVDREEMVFPGITATDSLEYIRTSYLIPKGFLGPTMTCFSTHDEEKEAIRSILPLKFKMTAKRVLTVDENNFDSIKSTIEPVMGQLERFEFNSEEHKKRYCEVFNIEYLGDTSCVFEATLVDIKESQDPKDRLFLNLENVLLSIGNRSMVKSKEKWIDVIGNLTKEYGENAVENVFQFLASGNESAMFWLKNITTPAKLLQHFEQMEQICNIEELGLMRKIKADPEIQARISKMRMNGKEEHEISEEIKQLVSQKLASGVYDTNPNSDSRQAEKQKKREAGEELEREMRAAGYDNLFDYIAGNVSY